MHHNSGGLGCTLKGEDDRLAEVLQEPTGYPQTTTPKPLDIVLLYLIILSDVTQQMIPEMCSSSSCTVCMFRQSCFLLAVWMQYAKLINMFCHIYCGHLVLDLGFDWFSKNKCLLSIKFCLISVSVSEQYLSLRLCNQFSPHG